MGYSDSSITSGVLLSSQDPWTFWGVWVAERPNWTERSYREEWEVAREKYLGNRSGDGGKYGNCAVVITASSC